MRKKHCKEKHTNEKKAVFGRQKGKSGKQGIF